MPTVGYRKKKVANLRGKPLKLSDGLDSTAKYIQSTEGNNLINTPLAVSTDTVMVKGDLQVYGEVTSNGEKLTGATEGDITVVTAGTGLTGGGTSGAVTVNAAQDIATDAAVTFASVDTGQGANELYDMDQNVKTDSTVGFAEITSGAVIWQAFPFIVTNGVAGRPYYRDVDDLYGDFRKWDDYDTSPTSISRGDVPGQYVVPESCTLKGMQAVATNATSSQDIDIHIYTGTPNFNTSSATTLALAGGAVSTVSISTVSYNYGTHASFDVDLVAGDIVVPMVEHDSGAGNQTFRGNITLKFLTR